MERSELLRSNPLFEELAQGDLNALGESLVECSFLSGETVFSQGDEGSCMYIVASGSIRVFLSAGTQQEVVLADMLVGDYIGELALLDGKPRSASARALVPAVLLRLSRETFLQYADRRPGVTLPMLGAIAGRLRQTNAILSERAAKNVVEEFEKGLTWTDRLADKVAELNGSWSFLTALGVFTVIWVLINIPGLLFSKIPDAYPYQFFNLVLAVIVALQGPLIVMSQNRQAAKDRKEAEMDFRINLKNEVNTEAILCEVRELRAKLDTFMRSKERSENARRENAIPPLT